MVKNSQALAQLCIIFAATFLSQWPLAVGSRDRCLSETPFQWPEPFARNFRRKVSSLHDKFKNEVFDDMQDAPTRCIAEGLSDTDDICMRLDGLERYPVFMSCPYCKAQAIRRLRQFETHLRRIEDRMQCSTLRINDRLCHMMNQAVRHLHSFADQQQAQCDSQCGCCQLPAPQPEMNVCSNYDDCEMAAYCVTHKLRLFLDDLRIGIDWS